MPNADGAKKLGRPVGVGLGLRWDFLDDLLERIDDGRLSRADLPFFEVSPENYMRRGGHIPESLERVAEAFPLISHGLAMSLGGVDAFDRGYFEQLRRFVERFAAPWHSDHLCFGGSDGRALHDLLPLPHTRAAARHCAERAREARDRLGVPFAVENISYYLTLGHEEMSEPQFVAEVIEAADCGILLDVNNVYVNSLNHGIEPRAWLAHIDLRRVFQIHVAGHEYRPADELYIDTHGAAVADPVIDLLSWVIERTGPVAVVLERDNDVPDLDTLLAEVGTLRAAYELGLTLHCAKQVPSARPAKPTTSAVPGLG